MRVFVTGIGAVSCAGVGVAAFERTLQAGRNATAPLSVEQCGVPTGTVVGMVDDLPPVAGARIDALLDAALVEALDNAALPSQVDILPVYLGTAHGRLDQWRKARCAQACAAVNPWAPNIGALEKYAVAIDVTVVSTACTASSVAMGLALDALRNGACEIAIAAGAEAMNSFLYSGFASLRSLTRHCRPFDRDRNGLVLGEGAAALVLETEAHMRRRGGTPLAEVAGFGFAADAAHLTAPDPAGVGATMALRAALRDAQVDALPDAINAHGTGTKLNDQMECAALRRVFGDDIGGIAISATKPITGHLCGGAGAIEAVACIVGMRASFVPPVLGLRNVDPQFAQFDFVRDSARSLSQRVTISMNSGFGGTNTAIVLRRASDAHMASAVQFAH